MGLNERTCLNQKPIVKLGQKVKAGQIIADGGGTSHGVLALGKNVLVGFVSFDGYNFEDAIIVSERLVKDDSFTSIHIDEFTVEVRETRLGKEEFTRDIPNVSEKALRNLDEHGIVREGTRVCPGDILVGKVVPKSKMELTPEEKLLHAIFGRAGEDVKNDSLELPSGYEGVVIKTERVHPARRRRRGPEEGPEPRRSSSIEAEMQGQGVLDLPADGRRDPREARGRRSSTPPPGRRSAPARTTTSFPSRSRTSTSSGSSPPSIRDEVQKIVDKFWAKITEIAGREEAADRADQARRRAAQRRAGDGQDLRGDQADAVDRRQDGRPARQQGRHRQDHARRGHAVPGRRHAAGHPAQSARRAQPYERRPDSRDAPGLGGARCWASTP